MNDSLIETLEDWLASVISEGQPYRAKTLRQTIEALKPIEELEAKVEKLTYLVTELDAHEGAEAWSDYLENRLKVWRKQQGEL